MSAAPPGSGGSEFRRGWPIVLAAMLGIGLGLSPMPFYTIGVLAPQLAHAFGWGYAQIMAGLTVTSVVVLAASPLTGLLADRVGVRPVALVSLALFGVAFMAFAANPGSLPVYYATFAILALVGAGTLPITWTRGVNAAFDRSRGLALGLSLLGTGLFGYFAKPYAAWAISAFGWRGAYMALGILPLALALPVGLAAFREPARPAAAADAKPPGLDFWTAVRHWRFWLLAAAFLPIAFAVGGPIPNMENILKLAHFAPDRIVGLTSLIGLSVIGGRVIGGWLIDRIWAPLVALVFLGGPAVGCWWLAHGVSSYAEAAASIVMVGFAAGLEYDLMAFLTARYFGMRSYASIYGALYGFFAAGAGVAPVVFGAAFDRTGGYGGVLRLAAAMLVGGAALLLCLGPYRRFETAAGG